MKLNYNEYLALDTIFNGHRDEGSKLDMVEAVKAGERTDGHGFCETYVEDIAKRLDISVNAAKGYIGSLAKKELIEVVDESYDMILILNAGILEWDAR